MSKPRKPRADVLLRQADTEKKRETLFMAKRRILRAMFKEGLCTEAESQEQYVALDCILRLLKDPTTRPELRFLCAKELWPHEAMTLAEEARVKAIGDGGPVNIQISVASWAKPASPAVPAPDETIIEADTPRTNGTPPTPPMSEQSRLQKTVNAQRPTQIYEVPSDPSKPKELIGEMSQAKGYLTKEQIMERLSRGPQQ